MDFIYLIMLHDNRTSSTISLVAYESEEDANEDLSTRKNDKHHSFHIESLPFYKNGGTENAK